MVGTDGAVKVLDFGLAKLTSHEAENEDPTVTDIAAPNLSVPGRIAGTAAYMSPEQATGRRVDARSDIFSFGAMLYEMVTGVRAFAGRSTADTLDAVLRVQPKSPLAIVSGVPSELEKVIMRCLRKDPERRFQGMADVKVALQEIKEDSESATGAAVPPPRKRRGRLTAAVVGTAALVVVVTWLLWRPQTPAASPLRVVPLTALTGDEGEPAFSPDGDQVAFSWDGGKPDTSDIYVKLVGSSEVRQLTTDPAWEVTPSWSRDGRRIAYLRFESRAGEGRIHVMSSLGGGHSRLSDFPTEDLLAWSPDNRFIAAARMERAGANDSTAIYVIPSDGGEPRAVTRAKRPAFDKTPAFSPDGRRLAYVSCAGDGARCNVSVVDLDVAYRPTAPARQLTSDPVSPAVSLGVAMASPSSTADNPSRGSPTCGAWR